MIIMARVLLAALLLASPVAAFVAPGTGVTTTEIQGRAIRQPLEPVEETFDEASNSNFLSVLTTGFGVGAVLGWLSSRKQQLASTAAAAAVAVAPGAAQAMVDYDGIKYFRSPIPNL